MIGMIGEVVCQESLNLENLKKKLHDYAEERNWRQFHSPKNLAMALSVEAAELVEIFQWVKEEESWKMGEGDKREAICDEVADILLYLVRLSDILGINIPNAVEQKIEKNSKKYPPEKSWGSSKKYNELD